MVMLEPRLLIVAITVIAGLLLGGCGDDDATQSSVSSFDDLEDAADGADGELTGFVVATDEQVFVCEALAESDPPQCGGLRMQLGGIDAAGIAELFPDAVSKHDSTWTPNAATVSGRFEVDQLVVEG